MAPPALEGSMLWLTDAGTLSEAALDAHAGWLGESESKRCRRFVRPLRRRQFIVGRALLRSMIGRLCGLAPVDIHLLERPGNAPLLMLAGHPSIGFSISHSGPWVACAVSLHCAVGLDIERMDPARDLIGIAEQAFDVSDAEQVRVCAAETRVDVFYRLWCLHEAAIKLGQASAADHTYTHADLALALRCDRSLAAAPGLELVELQEMR